jgi:hypothetical protein
MTKLFNNTKIKKNGATNTNPIVINHDYKFIPMFGNLNTQQMQLHSTHFVFICFRHYIFAFSIFIFIFIFFI